MALIDTRRDQMFPVFSAAQVEIMRRFASAEPKVFAAGETVYDVGQRGVPAWLVLEGSLALVRRDGRGPEEPIITERVGQFSGEVSQLAGRASLTAARAGETGLLALPFDAPHLRALVIG